MHYLLVVSRFGVDVLGFIGWVVKLKPIIGVDALNVFCGVVEFESRIDVESFDTVCGVVEFESSFGVDELNVVDIVVCSFVTVLDTNSEKHGNFVSKLNENLDSDKNCRENLVAIVVTITIIIIVIYECRPHGFL